MPTTDFEFRTVASIAVEWGGAQRLGKRLAATFTERRAFVVTDAGLVRAGLIAPVLSDLQAAGFEVALFDAVIADPPERLVRDALARARAGGADLVIGLGGGSSLDIAKLVAVLLRTEQDLADLYGIGKIRGQRARLVLVPTTAGDRKSVV